MPPLHIATKRDKISCEVCVTFCKSTERKPTLTKNYKQSDSLFFSKKILLSYILCHCSPSQRFNKITLSHKISVAVAYLEIFFGEFLE